jgi:hypothetical protein
MLRSGQHVRLLYSGGILLILAASLYFGIVLAEAGFNIKALGDRVPALVWITLMMSVGFQCFFFGFILQLLKEMKYRLDRVGIHTATRRPKDHQNLQMAGKG